MRKIFTASLLEVILLLATVLLTPAWADDGSAGNENTGTAQSDTSLQKFMDKIDGMEKDLKELQDQILILMDIIDHMEKQANTNEAAITDLETRNQALQKQIDTLEMHISANKEKIDFLYRQYRFDFVEPESVR